MSTYKKLVAPTDCETRFEHVRSSVELDEIEFHTLDGSEFRPDPIRLYSALQILLSYEFDSYIHDVNEAHENHEVMVELEKKVANGDVDETYALVTAAMRFSKCNTLARETRYRIIDKMSYGAWFDAKMLYEVLYGIEHYDLEV